MAARKNKKTDRELLEEVLTRMDEMKKVNEEMKEKLTQMDKQLKKLEHLEKEVNDKNKQIELLEYRVEELEQRSRMTNIIVRGIKEVRGEDCTTLIENVGKHIGVANPLSDIQICHRVPSRNKKAPRPIVVRLLNSKTRDVWVKKAKHAETWKEKLFVHEHLTSFRQNLFHQTKELAKKMKYKYVWTKDCKILLKKTDTGNTHVIHTAMDLKKIEASSSGSGSRTLEEDAEETFSS
ncbi:hypothetical protein M8J76_014032 [Diaphorina citri]|nr:hypothetical protein M8J75_012276 [Diaphorina citri]KAI5705347.1 hypothetical protein M8J75_014071 [Diaphorina citri]KAI5737483.1 hypothetical protein M8J76_014032 [Diaphorina citri]KAI5742536.1 hypothetical protein M8J77_008375 [Diaphorina citri]